MLILSITKEERMKAMKTTIALLLVTISIITTGCAGMISTVEYPDPDLLFVTTGDGDIQRPYTPIGQLIYTRSGSRLSLLPILGMLNFDDVNIEQELQEVIAEQVAAMGGDAIINLSIDYERPSNGFLGLGSRGGSLLFYGTVIKR